MTFSMMSAVWEFRQLIKIGELEQVVLDRALLAVVENSV